jgi:hypothetical protein
MQEGEWQSKHDMRARANEGLRNRVLEAALTLSLEKECSGAGEGHSRPISE